MSGYHSKNWRKDTGDLSASNQIVIGDATTTDRTVEIFKTGSAPYLKIRSDTHDAWLLIDSGGNKDGHILFYENEVAVAQLRWEHSDGVLSLEDGAGTKILSVDVTNARVGINDTTPTYALDVNGDIRTTGVFRSADGTGGATGSGNNVTVKDGIVVAVS